MNEKYLSSETCVSLNTWQSVSRNIILQYILHFIYLKLKNILFLLLVVGVKRNGWNGMCVYRHRRCLLTFSYSAKSRRDRSGSLARRAE